jgi:hypothetical protein
MNLTGTSVASLQPSLSIIPEATSQTVGSLDKVALNPQPLPPKNGPDILTNTEINPQPLPPKDGPDMVTNAGIIVVGGYQLSLDDDFCGNGRTVGPPIPHGAWASNAALPNQQVLQGAVQFS